MTEYGHFKDMVAYHSDNQFVRPDIDVISSDTATTPLRYVDIFQRFYNHPYGQHLAGQEPRFTGHFGYDDNQLVTDLGSDAHPLMHNLMTYYSTVDAVRLQGRYKQHVPYVEQAVAYVSAGTHDMGETTHPDFLDAIGAVAGDAAWGTKQDKQRKIEADIRQIQYGLHLGDLVPWFVDRVEAVTSHEDHESLAYRLAHSAHAVNSLRTCMRAGALVMSERLKKSPLTPRIRQLEALASIGVANAVAMVEPFAMDGSGIVLAQKALEKTSGLRAIFAAEIDMPTDHPAYGPYLKQTASSLTS